MSKHEPIITAASEKIRVIQTPDGVIITRSRKSYSAIAMSILLLVSFVIFPWLWKSLPDRYFAYAGTVVEKGTEDHNWLTGTMTLDHYIVVQDERGVKTKKYVSAGEYAFAEVGTYVVKKQGFGKWVLQPGQKDPREVLRDYEKTKQR